MEKKSFKTTHPPLNPLQKVLMRCKVIEINDNLWISRRSFIFKNIIDSQNSQLGDKMQTPPNILSVLTKFVKKILQIARPLLIEILFPKKNRFFSPVTKTSIAQTIFFLIMHLYLEIQWEKNIFKHLYLLTTDRSFQFFFGLRTPTT
ncbi:hypothetical protein LissoIVSPER_00052 [Lissonota sp. PSUC_FEM 10030012]|nr:hypothetical protein [Lissonota sp. PSUC_FEM 10030012]